MNDAYGFGSFRQKIWLDYGSRLAPEYEAGYHFLFRPLVRLAFGGGQGLVRRGLRRILEHIARHRTADLWALKRGRRNWIGAIERAVLEPVCYLAGWFVLRLRR